MAAALTFSYSLEVFSFRAELSCSKVSTRASNSLTFSDCSREDFSRVAIFSSCCDWSAINWRSSPVRRRNSACSATCLASSCHQDTVKTSTRQHNTKYSSTYSKHELTAQDPAGHGSRPLSRLSHFLPRHFLQNLIDIGNTRRTFFLILGLLI